VNDRNGRGSPWAYTALCSELLLFLSRLAARFCFSVLDAAVLVLLPPLSLLAMASSLGRGPIRPPSLSHNASATARPA
jgi:hypothetical protein